MARVKFPKGEQRKFLDQIYKKSQLGWKELGLISGVSERTLRDWRREKYTASYEALLNLSRNLSIKLPESFSILDDFWYVPKGARKGALNRNKLYGNPGTKEGREKGGRISQLQRKKNPEYYRKLGCIVRNKFRKPRHSTRLAEFLGTLLGDGCVGNTQVAIYLNKQDDRKYADFICKEIKGLFTYNPGISEYEYKNTLTIRVSGINFVDLVENLGLRRGDKVKNSVGVPLWIKKSNNFSFACVRGLFDTDGGLYTHKHWSKGIRYRNLGWCFTSHSPELIAFVKETLEKEGFKVKKPKGNRLYMYDLQKISRYFRTIKSHNPKHLFKLRYHLAKSQRIS